MRAALFFSAALVGLAAAAPRPQEMDFDEILSEPAPTKTGPSPGEYNDPPDYDPDAAQASASAAVVSDLASSESKRDIIELQDLHKRDAACAPQPTGSGPVPTPDTAAAFKSLQVLHNTAKNAPIPAGYKLSFSDLFGSVQQNSYLGLYTLGAYDTVKCQQLCDAVDLCTAFNLFYERNPIVSPGPDCLNPPSTTNIKCTLWGSPVTPESAKNKGQYRRDFQVVISGSNGYTKDNPPNPYPGYDGPVKFVGAINAPKNANGENTYIGVKYFPGVFDAGQCIAACTTTTGYNSRHPRADGSYDSCEFFNAYLLSKNFVAEGTYCSLYTQKWGKPYDTNLGQYRGSDRYTVGSSYGYSLHH